MDYLGSGYFYDVYKISKLRVLKTKKGVFQQILSNKFTKLFSVLKQNYSARKNTTNMKNVLRFIDGTLLGNPIFVSKYNYEQDIVTPLYLHVNLYDLKESKPFIDAYFDLIQQFIRYGFFDYVCKFKDGYGVTIDGKLIYIDFNEVTFSKQGAINLVREDVLIHESQFRKLQDGETKEYIREQCKKRITVAYVEDKWGSDLQ